MHICHYIFNLDSKFELNIMQDRKVIHLEINRMHYYYGSMSAIFDDFTEDQIGFSYYTIKNRLKNTGILENDKCTIRLGTIKTKKGVRGKYERKS